MLLEISRIQLRSLAAHGVFAHAARQEAITDAGLPPDRVSHPRTGMLCASAGSKQSVAPASVISNPSGFGGANVVLDRRAIISVVGAAAAHLNHESFLPVARLPGIALTLPFAVRYSWPR